MTVFYNEDRLNLGRIRDKWSIRSCISENCYDSVSYDVKIFDSE